MRTNALTSWTLLLVFLGAALGGWQEGRGQSDIPLYQYTVHPTGFGARQQSFARANAASASDATSMYWNPASLSFVTRNTVSVNHMHDWDARGYTELVAIPMTIAQGHYLGVGVSVSHFGYLGPKPDPGIQFTDFGLDLGYSVNVMPTLSLGTVFSFRYAKSSQTSLTANWVSLGAFYFPAPDISYGVVFHSAGTQLEYSVFNTGPQLTREPLPRKSVEIGATMRFPTRGKQPIVTMSLSNERSFPDNTYRIMGGIEIAPFDFVAFRIGYGGNPTTVAGHYGIGFNYDRLRLDYAISPSKSETRYDTFTFSYVFGSR